MYEIGGGVQFFAFLDELSLSVFIAITNICLNYYRSVLDSPITVKREYSYQIAFPIQSFDFQYYFREVSIIQPPSGEMNLKHP